MGFMGHGPPLRTIFLYLCLLGISWAGKGASESIGSKAPETSLSSTSPSMSNGSVSGGQAGLGLCDPCDLNCDNFRDYFDIPIFADALVQGVPTCSACAGDVDGNGLFNGNDIQLFVRGIVEGAEPSVVVLQNGTVIDSPAFPFEMEGYSDGDLPELRAFASAAGIFAGIDMSAEWKDREWEMIKAIQSWVVNNVRMSAVGLNSKEDLSVRAIGFLESLSQGGQVVAWGDDDRYGNVSGVSALSPNTGFVAVAAGRHHSMALRRSGEIEAWGRNQFGQGADPVPNAGFRAITAGANHNLALRSDGSILAWGDDRANQCEVPIPNANFVGIAAGIEFSVGLKADGTVVVWGELPSDVLFNEQWQGHFIKIAAGGFHCVGMLDDGTIAAWGGNGEGQCNVPTHFGSIPLQDRIFEVSAGKRRSYATVDLGSGIVSWGLPLSQSSLPGGRFRFVWPSPNHKYLLASMASVPNEHATIESPLLAPPPSSMGAVAYDSDREVVVRFGGQGPPFSPNLRDTVEWDGREWDEISPPISPSARFDHCMAYDALWKRTVLWGAADGLSGRDAWEWDGKSWSGPYASSQGTRPLARLGCRAIWDPNRGQAPAGRVTVFFGRNAMSVFDTAYDYNAATHTFMEREISGSPGARHSFGLAYDSARDKIVVFGGANGAGNALNDTHEAVAGGTGATTFSLVHPVSAVPAARYEHAMVFDKARRMTVMYGGRDGDTRFDETWEWDGMDWVLKSPAHSPGQRSGHDMVYDEERERIVLFGGYRGDGNSPGLQNDTWEWDGEDWTQKNLTIIPEGEIPDPTFRDLVYVGYAPAPDFGIGLTDYVWSCGAVQQIFTGLCVAHGIPSRRIDGTSLGCASDQIVQAFSTRWNKWILFWQHVGRWVENGDGVPQSHAEMRAHHAAANYRISPGYELAIGRRGWKATAQNGSGLVFQPNAVCTAPLHPRAHLSWWSDKLKVDPVSPDDDHDYFDRNLTTSLSKYNQPGSQSTIVLLNDYSDIDAICGTNMSGQLRSFDGDPNLTYPVNNVHAEAELVQVSPPHVEFTLTHNMLGENLGFPRFEESLDGGQTWTRLLDDSGVFHWYPTSSAQLMVRGVNRAGVHSPDVVIQFRAGVP